MMLDRDERRRWAFLEAGPAAAAVAWGIPVRSVTIEGPRPQTVVGTSFVTKDNTRLERLCAMALSGAAAEEFYCGSCRGARVDDEIAREYLAQAFEPSRVEAELASLRTWARWMVLTPWAQKRVRLVAVALRMHGTLDGAVITALCGTRRARPAELVVDPDPRPEGERHDAAKLQSARAGDQVAP